MNPELKNRLSRIKLMIFDVDGVLTDGKMHYGADGELFKSFNVLDGHGIKLLKNADVSTAIISARNSPIVNRRATDLEIGHVIQGAGKKQQAFAQLLEKTGHTPDQCGFIGDDIIDLPVLTCVGVSFSVPNGHVEVLSRVDYVTRHTGGNGAVREVCDMILHAKGCYTSVLETFLA
ncbi:KdsC family phosphatase [Oxalobacter paraformigenes]|uniref:3-deoxy-D-manno-octulosonate 8-phosphate phosphatase KdsC n=1 Tax=Oxalobacter paraformigenes TaxID=556268 RepID=C3X4T9_9BURK|nr:HAD hydrolase family protein [Oxalobacter paraformigenes]EEO28225.2 YrbI family 3-deoxy-D-manno-octulosonate 8-phosphate phosphatase [Oxalobacter paraformigenes]